MSKPIQYRRLTDGSWEVINDDGTRSIIWGVASTGQKAKQGTVEFVDRADGSRDVIARPAPAGLGIRSGSDFVKEPDLNVDLAELESALVTAMKNGEVTYTTLPDGRAVVDFESFQAWILRMGR